MKNFLTHLDYRKIFHSFLFMTIGSFLLAIAVKWLIIPTNISAGGSPGFALLLNKLFNISMDNGITILTIFFLIIGFLFLGRAFTLRTIYGAFSFPFFLQVLPKFDLTNNDPLLAMIVAGTISGISIYFMLQVGGSTGGTSIPPFIFNKYFNISITTGIIIIDGLSIATNIVVGNFSNIFYGIIHILVVKFVADYLMTGLQKGKSLHIISEYIDEINDFIQKEIYRGTTVYSARGGYSNKERRVLMTIVSSKELQIIRENALHIDPNAFLIVGNVSEVHGEGFTLERPIRNEFELEMLQVEE